MSFLYVKRYETISGRYGVAIGTHALTFDTHIRELVSPEDTTIFCENRGIYYPVNGSYSCALGFRAITMNDDSINKQERVNPPDSQGLQELPVVAA